MADEHEVYEETGMAILGPEKQAGSKEPIILARVRQLSAKVPAVSKHLPSSEQWHNITRFHLLPIGLYFLITAILTWPLIIRFPNYVQGDGGDAWQNIWNYWWTGRALVEHHNPFVTPYLYAPYGAPLYLYSLNLFNGLSSLPALALFGPVAAYNFVVFLSFTLAGYWTYLLTTYLSGNRYAGFLCGIIYAFSSYQISQLFIGQANLFASEWLPALVFGLVGANRTGGKPRVAFVGLSTLSLVCLMLCDWQYIIFAFIFMVLFTGYEMAASRSLKPLLISFVAGLIFLAVAAPLIWKTYAFINSNVVAPTNESFVRAYSADLFSFIIPGPRNWLLGNWTNSNWINLIEISHNRSIYLGIFPVLLSLYGLRKNRRNLFWLGTGLVFVLLALGPRLQVGGTLFAGVLLPFNLIENIPGVNTARVPARFVIITVLCLAVLASFGLTRLIQDRPVWQKPRNRWLITGLLAVLLLSEHVIPLFPGDQAQLPQFYRQLAASTEKGTVLEIPYRATRSISLYYQTIHQHPMIGGYLSRIPEYTFTDLPPMRPMPNSNDIIISNNQQTEAGLTSMELANVKWIVVLLKDPQYDRASIAGFVNEYAQPAAIYKDDLMEVYRPKPPSNSGSSYFVVELKGGWHEPEASDIAPARKMRWFERRGGMYAWNISNQTQNAQLNFDVWSFVQPRQLVVRVDNVDVGQWVIKDFQHVSLPLTLQPGRHQIELRAAAEEPQSPAQLNLGSDQRLLSLAVTNLEIKSR